jgi:hypothetical protein
MSFVVWEGCMPNSDITNIEFHIIGSALKSYGIDASMHYIVIFRRFTGVESFENIGKSYSS